MPAAPIPGQPEVRQNSHRFTLVIPGFDGLEGKFTSFAGTNAAKDVITYYEGGDDEPKYQLGRTTYGQITITRGVVAQWAEMYEWIEGALLQTQTLDELRRTIYLYPLSETKERLGYRFVFEGCLPVTWSLSDFNAESSEISIESLVVQPSKVRREAA